jgi:tRNA (guanine10-N2)-dimethyltransferase
MKYLFELSKEHKKIPKDEIFSILKSEDKNFDIIEKNQDILVVKIDINKKDIKRISKRLSHCFFVNEFLFKSTKAFDELRLKANKNPIKSPGSVAVKYKNRSNLEDSRPIVRTLADVYTKNRKVKLDNPENEIRVIITNDQLYVGNKIHEIDRTQFEQRKVQNRPFFSPISLHPKIARALVNLSTVKKNDLLLDPFCGTGGIILEAGLMGIKTIGGDIEEKMIQGCKQTLDFYKIKNYNLLCSDIGDIKNHIDSVDAVVTDMPYGKSTTTKGEQRNCLYKRAFESISEVLKKDKNAIIGLPDKDFIKLAKKYFKYIDTYEFRIHKSLTRYFAMFKR